MSEKNYWKVDRGGIYAVITCPICKSWFDIPNSPGNVESYHFCPGCAKPLMVREEDKYVITRPCNPKCGYLAVRKEDYDDDFLGYCHACEGVQGKLIGSIDEINAGNCECVYKKKGK